MAATSSMATGIDYDTLCLRFVLVFGCEHMRLILIYHAESQHSRLGRVADIRSCIGLTEISLQQAQRLSHRFQASGTLRFNRVRFFRA
jgi:hypothetical protein